MAEDALIAVALRNKFYKYSQRRVVLALLIVIIINFILAGTVIYLFLHPPAPKYFATGINGRITPLIPLDVPNQSDAAILQWATQAAIAAFSYSFVNYNEELQSASAFFTEEGWKQFLSSLNQSNNLLAVKEKKLIVSAYATRPASIVEQGVLNGIYTWKIQVPIQITYQSSSFVTQTYDIVTLVITRVSTLSNFRGIGISQIVVAPTTGVTE